MKSLFEPHLNLVGKVLDLQLQRQNVVSSNIANVKTPGYRPRELDFESELQRELALGSSQIKRTHELHFPGKFDAGTFEGDLELKFKPRVIHGEDRVNIDREMAILAKNSLHYTALTQVMRGNFDGIKQIIQEGQK